MAQHLPEEEEYEKFLRWVWGGIGGDEESMFKPSNGKGFEAINRNPLILNTTIYYYNSYISSMVFFHLFE